MSELEQTIQAAAVTFGNALIAAVEEHLHAVISETFGAETHEASSKRGPGRPKKTSAAQRAKGARGRLARRSPEDIANAVALVAKVLRKGNLRAEDIRVATGLSTKEMPRVLKQGVADGAFKITGGQKRSTTYGLGPSRKSSAKKPARKPAKKPRAKARSRKAKAKLVGKTKKTSKASKPKKALKKTAKKPKAKAISHSMNGVAGAAKAADSAAV